MLRTIREVLKSIPAARRLVQALRWAQFRIRLRQAEAADRSAAAAGGVLLPPARLRHRVHGDFDRDHFLQVGATVATDLRRLVALAGREWSSFTDILDFGCGSGRVIRFLTDSGTARLNGTDIDAELVQWCQRNIPGADFRQNGFLPPLSYGDGAFDLVLAVSVFTHLDETFQNAWLAELARITRPGAVLVLTVHGESAIAKHRFSDVDSEELRRRGFLFSVGTTGALKLDGLPDFYQGTWHTRAYVQEVWGRFFEVVAHVPEGINHHQDGVVLRRR